MSSMSTEQIEILAEKKLSGTITPEEQEMLDAWLNRLPGEEAIGVSFDADEEAFRVRLLQRIKDDAGIRRNSKKIRSLQQHWRVAAAILLLIAGTLSYLLFAKQPTVLHSQSTVAGNSNLLHDKQPGHNGAILTLGNGKKIILDSTGNGKIATQGTLRLIKQNGLLTYQKPAKDGYSKNNSTAIYNTITTPRGRQYKLILSDGSKVWLNAASSITYPASFTDIDRKVKVTGEAYFEIAEDPKRPFIVSVNTAQVIVLGTHFNIMAYSDEKWIKTTLLDEPSGNVSQRKVLSWA